MRIFEIKTGLNMSGFTLIESVVYVACLSVFLGGLISLVFVVLKTGENIHKKIMVQRESEFILSKVEWVLNMADSVAIEESGAVLNTNDLGAVRFYRTADESFRISSQEGDFKLNSGNIKVLNAVFEEKIGMEGVLTFNLNINCKLCGSGEAQWYRYESNFRN
ncbi:MAG: hypothetical protein JNN11_01490 [Candidatus Doudnabacteria bacterium]|nr:hypothetical protein [Candidatus Doudnabacteria bacterium]